MSILVNVNDALTMGLAVGGTIFGYIAGRRKGSADLRTATCGCTHHLSFHKDGKGPCKAVVGERKDKVCACQVYAGPKILDVFAPQQYLPPDK